MTGLTEKSLPPCAFSPDLSIRLSDLEPSSKVYLDASYHLKLYTFKTCKKKNFLPPVHLALPCVSPAEYIFLLIAQTQSLRHHCQLSFTPLSNLSADLVDSTLKTYPELDLFFYFFFFFFLFTTSVAAALL